MFVISGSNKRPHHLAAFSKNRAPITFASTKRVLFATSVVPSARSTKFPSGKRFRRVCRVPISNKHPMVFSSVPVRYVSVGGRKAVLCRSGGKCRSC